MIFSPKSNVYSGTFNDDTWYQVKKNGVVFDHKPSLKIRNHSPDGFAWSYCGSGPAQLALAILLEEFNKDIAGRYYQDFKFEVIAGFSKEEGWKYTSHEVCVWLSEYLKKRLQSIKNRALAHSIDSSEWRESQSEFKRIVDELYDVTGTRFV